MFSTNVPSSFYERLDCSLEGNRTDVPLMLIEVGDANMPNILRSVQSPADVRQNVLTFNSEASHFYDRAARLLRETTYWVYDPVTESFGPSKFVGFAEMSFDRYLRALEGDSEGARFDGGVTQAAISNEALPQTVEHVVIDSERGAV